MMCSVIRPSASCAGQMASRAPRVRLNIIKRGFDDTEPARQRYACHDDDTRFDELTDTLFAGHHQPLKVRILCLYFMGLSVSTSKLDKNWRSMAVRCSR